MRNQAFLLLVISAAACGSEPTNEEPTPKQGPSAESSASPSQPVAVLELPNGNIVRFYDAVEGVLITEEAGSLNSIPTFTFPEIGQLVSSWREVAPAVPVPQALRDLQVRLAGDGAERPYYRGAPPRTSASHDRLAVSPEAERVAPRSDGEQLAAAGSCGNVCCDQTWLQANIGECNPNSASYFWNLFDYGWSFVHQPSSVVSVADGVVCSAQGASTWSAAWKNGGGFVTNVQQGFWLRHRFVAGTTCNPFCGTSRTWFNYDVNSQANQHGHAFCGYFIY
jgi:hypothetical protein